MTPLTYLSQSCVLTTAATGPVCNMDMIWASEAFRSVILLLLAVLTNWLALQMLG